MMSQALLWLESLDSASLHRKGSPLAQKRLTLSKCSPAHLETFSLPHPSTAILSPIPFAPNNSHPDLTTPTIPPV